MSQKQRNYLFQYMDVIDQHTQKLLGYLIDVSKSGFMYVSERPVPPNQIQDIYLETDTVGKEHGKVSIKLQVQVIWSRPNINPELFCVGCKIIDIGANDKKVLLVLAQSLSFDPDVKISRVVHDA